MIFGDYDDSAQAENEREQEAEERRREDEPERRVRCFGCDGHGGDGGQSDSGLWEWPCEVCNGTRTVPLFVREGFTAGLRRAQMLAKGHARSICCHECVSCDGEGYVDDEDSDADEDCPQCKGEGERMDKVEIDWKAMDQAIDAEAAKERE